VVKAILALALLALLGFGVAACGATTKIDVKVNTNSLATEIANGEARTITVAGSATTTIPNVKTGTRISCNGWPERGVRAPPPGTVAYVGGGEATPSGTKTSHRVELRRLENGSLTVSCSVSSSG
jgi:hypothetical protein